MNNGDLMYQWATDLFPINRSLTGNGVRETLKYFQKIIPGLTINEVPSGTVCFDWTIPREWNCKSAYIVTPNGEKICDFTKNNLHLVGYSIPINQRIEYEELVEHLHYLEDQPNAIPYITSYYKERWGFCLTYEEFKKLKRGTYKVIIDSELKDGFLTFGEIYIPGRLEKEVFLSTYICHPSMANNELSGPVVTAALVQFIKNMKNRKYSYRIIFIPETIGSIYYLSKNLAIMKQNIIAGFNITTIGDDRSYSYVQTRYGNTLTDKVVKEVLKDVDYKEYNFLHRGSDERQYCSPGVDLPIVTMSRSRFGTYPEYHTSLDDLTLISPSGLWGGYHKIEQAILLLEKNEKYRVKVLCEPQLGKRNLYPPITTKKNATDSRPLTNFIAYADGSNDLIDIANIIEVKIEKLFEFAEILQKEDLIEVVSE